MEFVLIFPFCGFGLSGMFEGYSSIACRKGHFLDFSPHTSGLVGPRMFVRSNGEVYSISCVGTTLRHERANPPLRPPRPNRTLGGTKLSADIVDVSSSISVLPAFRD